MKAGAETIGGRYCEDCGIRRELADANVSAFAPGYLPYAVDADRAEALWQKANEMVGERD